jgi:GAF domain-containing protein
MDPLTDKEQDAPRLLDALASLNRIGETINRIGPGDSVDVNAMLQLIVESATKVLPSASAVIYIYDQEAGAFLTSSRVSAGEWMPAAHGDEPRANGLGKRAIQQSRRVFSYEEADLEIHPIKSAQGAQTVACFPLVVSELPLGILYVYLQEARSFSQLEELMLHNFVNQAAMAIYQVQKLSVVQRDLARKDEELIRLRRAGLLISSRLRLEDTLEAILQMALEVTSAQYGIFRLLDKSGQYLITRAIAGEAMTGPKIENLPIHSNSIMGWVARTRQAVCIADLQSERWVGMYYPLDASLQMRSELAVPLVSASGRLEGVLNLEALEVGAFSEQDNHLLQSLATNAVIAIQEARLLDALQDAAQLLLSQPAHLVLHKLADLACDLLNANAGAIWTLEDKELILSSASGQRELILDSEIPQRVLQHYSPLVGDLPDGGQVLAMPLLSSDQPTPLGVIGVYSSGPEGGHYAESDWDKKVLACLAHYAALTVRSAAHQEALRTAQEQRAVAETFAVVGDIAANVLHHLNNKVGTIPVRIQGIQDKCKPALAADRYLAANLSEIERSANEAMEAVRDNLAHLRPIHMAEVGVKASVTDAIESAGLPAGIQVSMEGLDNLPPVVAGQRSLVLVFTNLLINAADAMRGSGHIYIRGAARQGWVEMVVSDDGPGIPPELHDRIFELNFSGRGGASRQGKLGFGLWWVKTLMTRLGGVVTVESERAQGATFRLKLPVAGAKK